MENKEEIKLALNGWFASQDKWTTKKELAAELGLSHSTVRKYFSEGRIPRKSENREKLYQLTGLSCFEADGVTSEDPKSPKAEIAMPKARLGLRRPTTPMVISLLNDIIGDVTEDISEKVKMRSFLQSLSRAMEKGELDIVSWMVCSDVADILLRHYPEAEGVLEEIKSSSRRNGKQEIDELEFMLEHYCDEKGVKLTGNSPRFVVDHLIHVEFEKKRNIVKVGTLHLQNPEWAEVQQSIEGEHKRIWGRDFNFSAFFEDLMVSYQRIIEYQCNDTEWVPLTDIYQEIKRQSTERNLKGRSVPYSEDEFSADLSKLWWAQRNGYNPNLYMEFSSNQDPRLCFEVILPDESTALYGFIRPKKTSNPL
jgi:hypothetical protein